MRTIRKPKSPIVPTDNGAPILPQGVTLSWREYVSLLFKHPTMTQFDIADARELREKLLLSVDCDITQEHHDALKSVVKKCGQVINMMVAMSDECQAYHDVILEAPETVEKKT